MTALASAPLSDNGGEFTDEDFDHLEEAKEALQDVVTSGRLDFTAAIEVAKTHALISIAESLDALAFTAELEDDEIALSVVNISEFNDISEPLSGSQIDYYREG